MKRKVRFADNVQIIIIPNEDRCGNWHIYEIDRQRFKRRCELLISTLNEILNITHREKIFNQRFR